MAVATRTYNTPIAIPDNNLTGIIANLSVFDLHIPTGSTVNRIEAQNLNITHTFDADLQIFLIDPDGNQIELSTGNGGSSNNYTNTTFSDLAATAIAGLGNGGPPFTGSFKPEQPLSTLLPGDLEGSWKLKVVDSSGGDTGTLQSFDLAFIFDYNGTVKGTNAHDNLQGSDGADKMLGLKGDDLLRGFKGDDTLVGGLGADVMLGGDGHDKFVYNSIKDSGNTEAKRDVIFDFIHLEDRIDLKTIDANTTIAGNQAFKFIGTHNFHNIAGELHFIKVDHSVAIGGSHTLDRFIVEGDVNGDGKADFQIELSNGFSMTTLAALTKADFVL